MKLQQKVLILGTKSGKSMNETDNLLLGINGTNTGVLLKNFFESYNQSQDEIKGHSFFGEFPVVDNYIKLSEELFISFFNKNSDEEVFVTRMKYPMIQRADIEADQEKFNALIKAEYEKIKPPAEEEGEMKVEISEEKIEFMPEIEGEKLEAEEEGEEEETKIDKEEAEALEKEESLVLVISEKYNKMRDDVISKGYQEFKFENYRLLINKLESKAVLILLVNSETYQKIDFKAESKNFENLVLSFGEGNKATLVNGVFTVI